MGMQTPWQRARKTRHEIQEDRNGKMPGGSKQVNSGRFWRWKRDNKLHDYLVESRTTEKGSYSITEKEFRQIEQDAFQTPPGMLPGMQIDIRSLSLFVQRTSDFQQMNLRIKELEARLEKEAT